MFPDDYVHCQRFLVRIQYFNLVGSQLRVCCHFCLSFLSDVVKPMAKFWGASHIKVLNIEEIGLGPSGFVELEKEMPKEVRLVDINVRFEPKPVN